MKPVHSHHLSKAAMEPQVVCGEHFASQMAREVALYGDIARELNLKAE